MRTSSLLLVPSLALVFCACATAPQCRDAPARYVDAAGNGLERFEDIWTQLHALFGTSLPERLEVVYIGGRYSQFDPDAGVVRVSTDGFPDELRQTVAHETTHIALARLSRKASIREPFRFLDEGFANIRETMVAGADSEAYRRRAFGVAALRHRTDPLDVARLQRWSTFFGRPRSSETDFMAYEIASSLVFVLLDKHGEAGLLRLFESLGRSGELEVSLRDALGTTPAELERAWLAEISRPELIPPTPELVSLEPANGAEGVPPGKRQLRAVFSVPMDRTLSLTTAQCDEGLCFTEARWESDRVLVVDAELKPGLDYALTLGYQQRRLRSRDGAPLPMTEWRFETSR